MINKNMNSFKTFIESSEEEKNVKDTISLLPKSHQKLLNGYKFKFTPGNTLKGDNDHIGYIHKNKIVVAAPWHYGRSFTTLHEIAHLVWEKLITSNLKKEWSALISKTKKQQKKDQEEKSANAIDQNDEELFAMAYAATYSKHPPKTFLNKEWQKFIKNLH